MRLRNWFSGLWVILFFSSGAWAVTQTEKIHNDRVLVLEESVAPGEITALPGNRASVVVYLSGGSVEITPANGKPQKKTVTRGEAVFQPPLSGTMKNVGSSVLSFVTTKYFGKGGSETWDSAGLAPDYRLLFENQYGRVYDIRMAAGKSEPLHSHHDRVVICLSGAELEHILTDGRKETSSLKTGEIAWRPGATHVGHNLGKSDLWVIAIEPK